jgi:nitrite reductase (NADH) small subunit
LHFNVGQAEDYADGTVRITRVRDWEIGIVRWRGEFYAIRNVCPHLGGTLCGSVRAHLTAEGPGATITRDETRPMLVCAWHKWEFDLAQARALVDTSMRIKMYPVSRRPDGSLWVELKRDGPDNPDEASEGGPAQTKAAASQRQDRES